MATLNNILTLLAILGTGLIAGTFFVFSVAIMPAFRRMPANEGMSAMQSINVVILNPLFLGVFIGTAVLSLALVVMAVVNANSPATYYIAGGAALYVIGSFLVTVVFNVPLNNALHAADPTTATGQQVWQNYLPNWTLWNHIRTVASILSTAAFALSYVRTN